VDPRHTAIEPATIDMLVPAAAPPIELPARPAGRIDRAIADHVARLIPDCATIELGLQVVFIVHGFRHVRVTAG
jgi:hypothetical protein